MKPSIAELKEEEIKMRRLRFLVDLTVAVLLQGDLSVTEAVEFVNKTKSKILSMFPDKEDVYNLIYKPRFERIIKERLTSN